MQSDRHAHGWRHRPVASGAAAPGQAALRGVIYITASVFPRRFGLGCLQHCHIRVGRAARGGIHLELRLQVSLWRLLASSPLFICFQSKPTWLIPRLGQTLHQSGQNDLCALSAVPNPLSVCLSSRIENTFSYPPSPVRYIILIGQVLSYIIWLRRREVVTSVCRLCPPRYTSTPDLWGKH